MDDVLKIHRKTPVSPVSESPADLVKFTDVTQKKSLMENFIFCAVTVHT